MRHSRKAVSFFLIWFTVALSGFVFSQTAAYSWVQFSLRDLHIRLNTFFNQPTEADGNSPLIILSIDEASFSRMGLRWPWGREIIAKAVENTAAHAPKVIGIDLAFVGKSSEPDADRRLNETLRRSPSPVLASYFTAEGELQLPHPSVVEDTAAKTGFINILLDSDGSARRMIVAAMMEEEILEPSFSLAVCLAYWGIETLPPVRKDVTKKKWPGGDTYLIDIPASSGETVTIRTDARLQSGFSYLSPPSRIPRISFWKALEGSEELEAVRGRIVLLGVEVPVMHDHYPTPLGETSGVGLHAIQVYSLLNRQFVSDLPFYASFVLFLAVIFIANYFVVYAGRRSGLSGAVLLFAVILGVSLYLFIHEGLWIDPSLSILGLIFLTLICGTYIEGSRLLTILELQNQLSRDHLTKVFSYRYLELFMMKKLKKMHKNDFISFIIFDIDHFKQINDTAGHVAGNRILKRFASVLVSSIRQDNDNIVARFGGDEFCMVLTGMAREQMEKVLSRIQHQVAFMSKNGEDLNFSFSAGGIIGRAKDFGRLEEDILSPADQALYEAKKKGRNQWAIAEASPHGQAEKMPGTGTFLNQAGLIPPSSLPAP